MDLSQIKAVLFGAAFIETRTEGQAALLDALAENVQLFLDRAALFERQGFPEMAEILRAQARRAMQQDLTALMVEFEVREAKGLPSTPTLPELPSPPPPPQLPPPEGKRPRGRPRKKSLPPEEPTNGDQSPRGWDRV